MKASLLTAYYLAMLAVASGCHSRQSRQLPEHFEFATEVLGGAQERTLKHIRPEMVAHKNWIILCGYGDEVILMSSNSRIHLRGSCMLWVAPFFGDSEESRIHYVKGSPVYFSTDRRTAIELLKKSKSNGYISAVETAHSEWHIGAELISENGRLRVFSVEPNSPAANAGLLAGDIILLLGDKPLGGDVIAWAQELNGLASQGPILLTVQRSGKNYKLTVEAILASPGQGSTFEGEAGEKFRLPIKPE